MFARFRLRCRKSPDDNMFKSELFDDKTFYARFLTDLARCKDEVIIESPFMTNKRVSSLLPILQKLTSRGTKIIINTRDPIEHDSPLDIQATQAIYQLQNIGAQVLFTGGHHRKLAILDRKILYEGSLNILSQNTSCEIMRRIDSGKLALQMVNFVGLYKFL